MMKPLGTGEYEQRPRVAYRCSTGHVVVACPLAFLEAWDTSRNTFQLTCGVRTADLSKVLVCTI